MLKTKSDPNFDSSITVVNKRVIRRAIRGLEPQVDSLNEVRTIVMPRSARDAFLMARWKLIEAMRDIQEFC